MKKVKLYTDGACLGNPGPGGWGAVLIYGAHEKELSGGEANTTNNRMELSGVIAGLEALKEPCEVELYSDSRYFVDAVSKNWLDSWRKRGWKRAGNKEVLNVDLWQRIVSQLERHRVQTIWVKGHAGNPYNERCDELAVAAAKTFAG
jgi:ribonuclease HI